MGSSSNTFHHVSEAQPLSEIMSVAPPTEEELQAKAAGLKNAETKQGGTTVDATVLATYKKAWADNNGDKDKICAALALDPAKWTDGLDEAGFIGKYLGKV